jgi:hypothetical protein
MEPGIIAFCMMVVLYAAYLGFVLGTSVGE